MLEKCPKQRGNRRQLTELCRKLQEVVATSGKGAELASAKSWGGVIAIEARLKESYPPLFSKAHRKFADNKPFDSSIVADDRIRRKGAKMADKSRIIRAAGRAEMSTHWSIQIDNFADNSHVSGRVALP